MTKPSEASVRNIKQTVLSNHWYTLNKVEFEYQLPDGQWQKQVRESYDRGNGAAILMYHPGKQTILLTRQFRMPTYLNGNPDGMLIEVPAGMLDALDPESSILKEVEEETGYRLEKVTKVFEAYMSPGAVTEVLHFFIADYSSGIRVGHGGGNPEETEHLEVLEISYNEILEMTRNGQIRDAKTLLLLQWARLQGIF